MSDQVTGLATEAAALKALAEKLRVLIPKLLEANHCATGEPASELSFEIVRHRQGRLLLAS